MKMNKLASFTLAALLLAPLAALYAVETIPLAGEWRFSLNGTDDLTGHIKLPGTIDDAGLGPKNTTPPTLEGPIAFTTTPARRGIGATSRSQPRGGENG